MSPMDRPAARNEPLRLRTDVLMMLGTRAVVFVLTAASSVIVARFLGPTGRGTVAVAYSLLLMLVQLGTFGLTSANPYFTAREPDERDRIVANSVWAAVVLGAALVGVGALVRLVAPSAVAGLTWLQLMIALVGIPVFLSAQFLQSVLLGEARTKAYNAVELVLAFVSPAVLAIGFAVLHMGVTGALVVMALTPLLGTVVYLRLLGVGVRPAPRPDVALARRMVRYAFRTYLAGLFAFLLIRIDMLLVNGYLGNHDAGLYSVAVAMGDAIYMISAVVSLNLFLRIARGASHEMSAEVFRSFFVIYGVFCLATVPLASLGIRVLYGPKFAEATALFYWLLPGIFCLGMLNVLAQHFAGRGFPAGAILVWIPGLALDVLLNVIFLKHHGVYIASLASSIAYAAILILHMRMFVKESGTYSSLRPRPREVVDFVRHALSPRPAGKRVPAPPPAD
jgi:O-antigen/teichoic acid export membrane protein